MLQLVLEGVELVGFQFRYFCQRHGGLSYVGTFLQKGKYVEQVLLDGKTFHLSHQIGLGKAGQGVYQPDYSISSIFDIRMDKLGAVLPGSVVPDSLDSNLLYQDNMSQLVLLSLPRL